MALNEKGIIHAQQRKGRFLVRGANPEAADSILYEDTDSVEALDLVTSLIRSKYPKAFKPRFHGANGVQVMEKDLVDKFRKETAHYPAIQFLTGIAELRSK